MVYWERDGMADHIGVAVGAFADPSFPAPVSSIWEESRHPWVEFGHDLRHFPQRGSGRIGDDGLHAFPDSRRSNRE